jgi:hypothetical protein
VCRVNSGIPITSVSRRNWTMKVAATQAIECVCRSIWSLLQLLNT